MSYSESFSKSRKFCSVPRCGKRGGGMFKFPSDQKLQNEWKIMCKLERTISATMYVCRRHFDSSDLYETTMGLTRVRKGAKPSLFLPTSTPVKEKPKHSCIVIGCKSHNEVERQQATLHSFPRDAGRRAHWHLLCRLHTATTRNTRICNQHFAESDFYFSGRSKILKRSARPNLLLPDRDNITMIHNVYVSKPLHPLPCEECPTDNHCFLCVTQWLSDSKQLSEESIQILDFIEGFKDNAGNSTDALDKQKKVFGWLTFKTSKMEIDCSILMKLNTSSQLTYLTGVSFCLLKSLAVISLDILANADITFQSMKMRIAITLCKLKLNLSFSCLGSLFGIDSSECVSYFVQTLPLLAKVLKCAIHWPNKDEVRVNMSKHFIECFDLRIVLDCIELSFHSKCSDSTSHLHSFNQDSHNMVKTLIGVAPCGLVSFVSQVYYDQTTYSKIFRESELISKNLIDPYNDAVLVSKALNIHDVCNEMAFRVLCPSSFTFISDKYTKDMDGRLQASFETFVKGIQEKLSMFQILKMKLNPCLITFAHDIIVVATGIVNLIATCRNGY